MTGTRRIQAVLVAVVLVAAALLGSSDTASADHLNWPKSGNENKPIEWNNGARSSAPGSCTFRYYDHIVVPKAQVCWVAAGDYWYVQDMDSDGRSAIAIWEDWTCVSSTSCPTFYRQGVCRNPYGTGTWARCNKDYYETGHVLYFTAGVSEGALPSHIMGFTVPFVACRNQTSCSV